MSDVLITDTVTSFFKPELLSGAYRRQYSILAYQVE